MVKYRLILSAFLVVVLLCLTSQAFGNEADYNHGLSVTFEEKLSFVPEHEDLINSETSLILKRSISGVNVESKTAFGKEDGSPGLTAQKVKLGYTTAEFSTNLKAVFDPPSNGLNYILQRAKIAGESLELSNTLLLEYLSQEEAFGAGFETELAGTTEKGVGVSAAIRFGMDESLPEIYDPSIDGSGYYIITDGAIGPSQFPFGSALIEVYEVGLGPCIIANRTKFMRGEGFLYSGFRFDLIDKDPWKARSYVYFTDEEKTITLVPTLQYGKDFWTVVADFGGVVEGDEDTTLGELVIRGVRFSGLFAGNLEISGVSSFGGKMKKEKGADKLELHAKDYKLVRSFDEIARDYMFEKVDWSDVITLKYDHLNREDLERHLALDWYFNRGEAENFFGVNTMNAAAEWELSSTFSFGTAVSMKVETGLERVVFNIVHDF